MIKRKRRIETFSFFDHTGICKHLEKMAVKGWMIERLTNFGWIYRRIEPKNIKFEISYYPKASEFDPEPSDDQKTFHEFCAHTGWKLACTCAQLQIFYNELENPIPIETEPTLEVQTIHASAKKSFIPAYILLLILSVLQCFFLVSGLLGDPIDTLSNTAKLFSTVCFFILLIICTVELCCYFSWYGKAKKAAEQGEFYKPTSTSFLQKIIFVAIIIFAVVWMADFILFGDKLQRWIGIAFILYIPLLFVLVNSVKVFLKNIKAPKNVNKTITVLSSFALSFLMMGLITFATIKLSSSGFFTEKSEQTYEHNGITWILHRDEILLSVEDLMDVDSEVYIKERRGSESVFLGQYVMRQLPRRDAEDYVNIPGLEYTFVDVKISALYDICKKRMIYEQESLYPAEEREYIAQDSKPWGAKEVYRLKDNQLGYTNMYLLCYDGILVEIEFDWEPTVEQMRIVCEKFNQLNVK